MKIPKGPLVTHLTEAIEANTHRMVLYAKLTGGASIPLSKKLIRSEQFGLPLAWLFDLSTRSFQKAGIPVGDSEYISMSKVPSFSECYPFSVEPLTDFKPVDAKKLSKKLKSAFKLGNFEGLSKAATIELEKLHKVRAYHAMTKHILESLIRAANLAPLHEKKAKELNYRSPIFLSKLMIWGHFPAFSFASKFDQDLAPLQAQGIPILWQDVPHIPPN